MKAPTTTSRPTQARPWAIREQVRHPAGPLHHSPAQGWPRWRRAIDLSPQEGAMQEERYGVRDRAYSAWHRRLSIRRYIGIEQAVRLSMIDLDGALYVEFDDHEREPLALIETALDVGQSFKSCSVTARLARRAGLPAYVVLYQTSSTANPADARQQDIQRFRVRRIWPHPEPTWRHLTPKRWAEALLEIRAWASARLDSVAANDPQW